MKKNYISPKTLLHVVEMESLMNGSATISKTTYSGGDATQPDVSDVPATPGLSSDARRTVWDDGSEEEEQL